MPGVRFEFSSNDTSPKPASVVSARSSTVLGQFSLWNTGESDFDIYKDGEVVSHEWGMRLDEASLPTAFDRFVDELRKNI